MSVMPFPTRSDAILLHLPLVPLSVVVPMYKHEAKEHDCSQEVHPDSNTVPSYHHPSSHQFVGVTHSVTVLAYPLLPSLMVRQKLELSSTPSAMKQSPSVYL